MHPEKMKNVLALDAQKRLSYFVQKCADSEEIWGLRNADGWCGMGTDDGKESIPFWPEEAFAVLLAEDDWADCTPARIPLEAFLMDWLPGMQEDGLLAAIFPLPTSAASGTDCVTLEAEHLRALLQEERENFWGLA